MKNLKNKFLLVHELDKVIQDYSIDINAYLTMIKLLDIFIKKHRLELKEMISCLNHDIEYETDIEELSMFYSKIKEMFNKLPDTSLLKNTYLRLISAYTFTDEEMRDQTEYMVPFAYDESLLPARYNDPEMKILREEFESYLDNGNSYFMRSTRSLMMHHKFLKKPTLLSNGSKMDSIQGMSMTDITHQIFGNEEWLSKVKPILDFFNNEDYDYIFHRPDHEISISYIPDKGLKVRIIYRIVGFLSVALKHVHDDLDRVARQLINNCTYDQTKWLIGCVNNGYHRNKLIITTDMSKYSDTLPWIFIERVLRWRYPKEVVDAITWCFKSIAKDDRHDKYYKDLKSSLQGLFTDFVTITVVNLCAQDFIYYKLNQAKILSIEEDRNAAVGDDTGMVFDSYEGESVDGKRINHIFNTIVDVYNAIGVNINTDKTHIMVNGQGFVDFVKLRLTKDGIGFSFSARGLITVKGQEVSNDVFIRDICNLYHNIGRLDDKRHLQPKLLEVLCNNGYQWLVDTSIINGGLGTHFINENDIKLFQYRIFNIHDGEIRKYDDVTKFELRNRLRDLERLSKKVDLTKTRLKLLVEEGTKVTKDAIILRLLNLESVGFKGNVSNKRVMLNKLIGYDPTLIWDDTPEDIVDEVEFLKAFPISPKFGKSKIKNSYDKLKDMVINYRYCNWDVDTKLYGNMYRSFLTVKKLVEHVKSGDNYTLKVKIMQIVYNYTQSNGTWYTRCVFGQDYDYCTYKGNTYIIGIHEYSIYPSVPDELIREALIWAGYTD